MELLKKREMWPNSQTISLLPTSSEVFLCVSGSSFWSQQNSIPKLLYTEVEITFYKSVPWWGKMNLLSEGELKISKTFSRAIHYLYCFLWKSMLLSIFHRKCFISSLITGAKKCTYTDRTRRPWPLTTVNKCTADAGHAPGLRGAEGCCSLWPDAFLLSHLPHGDG